MAAPRRLRLLLKRSSSSFALQTRIYKQPVNTLETLSPPWRSRLEVAVSGAPPRQRRVLLLRKELQPAQSPCMKILNLPPTP